MSKIVTKKYLVQVRSILKREQITHQGQKMRYFLVKTA